MCIRDRVRPGPGRSGPPCHSQSRSPSTREEEEAPGIAGVHRLALPARARPRALPQAAAVVGGAPAARWGLPHGAHDPRSTRRSRPRRPKRRRRPPGARAISARGPPGRGGVFGRSGGVRARRPLGVGAIWALWGCPSPAPIGRGGYLGPLGLSEPGANM